MINLENQIKQINFNQKSVPYYFRLLDIFEGNLNPYVAQSLAQELSPESYKVASTRIPSINLLRRIVKKLSKVYTETPNRTTLDPQDKIIIDDYVKQLDLQNLLSNAEDILNINKTFALEPYIDEGQIKVRVLAPHQFTVLSNSKFNPTKMDAFVKYMGSESKTVENRTYLVNNFWIYTNEYLIQANSDGDINSVTVNPYNEIPFIYVNASANLLIPQPDNDTFNNTILIPKLLADLNYATQFQSHSIMYSIDAEISKASGAPDSMWNLSSKEGDNKTPQVGVLSPSVDTDKVLSLVNFTVSQWLESRGIKAASNSSVAVANVNASGISKIIDEADCTQVIQENRLILIKAEQELWQLIAKIHNTLLGTESFSATRGLSEDLHVSVTFPIQAPVTNPEEARNQLKFKLENKLTSYMAALREANPNLSEDELQKLKLEIEAESQQNKANNK